MSTNLYDADDQATMQVGACLTVAAAVRLGTLYAASAARMLRWALPAAATVLAAAWNAQDCAVRLLAVHAPQGRQLWHDEAGTSSAVSDVDCDWTALRAAAEGELVRALDYATSALCGWAAVDWDRDLYRVTLPGDEQPSAAGLPVAVLVVWRRDP